MKGKLMFVLFLLAVIAIAGVQQVTARQAYMDAYNTTFNTNATCSVCHVNAAGGGSLNSYGTIFQSQPNYNTDPATALAANGPTTVTPTPTMATTTTPIMTATTVATITATPAVTPTLIATETPTEMPTTIIETPTEVPPTTIPTATRTTPGFEAVFMVGLLAGYVLLKQRNK